MLPHLAVLGATAPLIVGLGFWNSRVDFFTPGELRFWGVCLFVAVEFLYLGVFT